MPMHADGKPKKALSRPDVRDKDIVMADSSADHS